VRVKERNRKANQRAREAERLSVEQEQCVAQSTQTIENIENGVDLSAGQARDIPGTSRGRPAFVPPEGKVSKGKEREDINIEATHRTVNSEQPARVASLEVVQGPNSSTVQPPAAVNDRHLMPRANDPPHRWIGSGLSRGPDRQPRTELVGTEPRLVAGIPGVNRVMVDHVARAVCEAALYEPSSRLDWNVLVDWLDSGLDIDLHILPGIRAVVERQSKGEKGYKQPGTLRYFTAPIREYVARLRAAA
jgi:hypothetical protein